MWKQLHLGDVCTHVFIFQHLYVTQELCDFFRFFRFVMFFLESAIATECLKIHSYAINWNMCYFHHLPLMEAGMNTIEK